MFENEPQVHPGLLDLDNAVLVPHLGSATVETRGAMAELAARNVVEVLAGRDPVTPVAPPSELSVARIELNVSLGRIAAAAFAGSGR